MTKQQFWKGLFTILVTVLVTAFGQNPDYAVLGIVLVSQVLVYTGKNVFLVFLTSTSQSTQWQWQTWVSGIVIAIGTGLADYGAQMVLNGVVLWPVLWKVVGGAALTYITTTFFAPPSSTSKKLFA
jgi:hypothetical protein